MEEIAPNIFIEQSYPGVVSSVMKLSHGLLLIDGPFRADDRLLWQQKLVSLGGGIGQLMVMLDTHVDRLLCNPLTEFPILAHENALVIIQDLPVTARSSEMPSGPDAEPYELPQNSRWCLPDMTYRQQVNIHWDDQPVVVTHQPGGHLAGSWVRYDAEKVVFVGDSVMLNQPPFLAWCDLDRWIDELNGLCSDTFSDYSIVSGRNGVVRQKSILKMIDFLTEIKVAVEELALMEDSTEAMAQWAPKLLLKLNFDRSLTEQYQKRLVWGLIKLIKRYNANLAEAKGD